MADEHPPGHWLVPREETSAAKVGSLLAEQVRSSLPETTKSAVIDPTGRYRYRLTRSWNPQHLVERRLLCVMLNPSTADAEKDDPTIRKCVHFADRDGFNSVHVVNLFAWRATDPKELLALDPQVAVGKENDDWISVELAGAHAIVVAWGRIHKSLLWRARVVESVLSGFDRLAGIPATCFGTNGDGSPKHPLYLSNATRRTLWPGAPPATAK